MKIYEGANEEGEMAYFEVPNTFLSRKGVLKIVQGIPGVQNVTFKKGDVFCSFAINSREFDAWEPFNDNSRFHVGEKEARPSSELEVIKSYFKAYKPWPFSIFS
jgi:hypothetical protein